MESLRLSALPAVLLIALTTGCIETQPHGPRVDAAMASDAGSTARVDTGTSPRRDARVPGEDASGADAATPVSLPAFVEILVSSHARVDVELVGSALVPTVIDGRFIQVSGMESLGSTTFLPTGTVGPCELYPPAGASTWPPASRVPATPVPLLPEYVEITADGAPVAVDFADGIVTARADLDDGTQLVVDVSYPGQAPIRRELILGPPLSVSSPPNAPSIDRAMRGDMDPGDGLRVEWPVVHDPAVVQVVDITGGSRGAARCHVTHGDGSVELSAGEIETSLLSAADDVALAVNLYASRMSEASSGPTTVRLHESWSAPSLLLYFPMR